MSLSKTIVSSPLLEPLPLLIGGSCGGDDVATTRRRFCGAGGGSRRVSKTGIGRRGVVGPPAPLPTVVDGCGCGCGCGGSTVSANARHAAASAFKTTGSMFMSASCGDLRLAARRSAGVVEKNKKNRKVRENFRINEPFQSDASPRVTLRARPPGCGAAIDVDVEGTGTDFLRSMNFNRNSRARPSSQKISPRIRRARRIS